MIADVRVELELVRARRAEDELPEAAGEAERLADAVEDDEAADRASAPPSRISGTVISGRPSCAWSYGVLVLAARRGTSG